MPPLNLQYVSPYPRGANGSPLRKIRMGLAWQPVTKPNPEPGGDPVVVHAVDLDASCVMFEADGRVYDKVSSVDGASRDGSVTHSGDDATGAAWHEGGDNESLDIDLGRVPPEVTCLVFTVSSFAGESLASVKAVRCRLVDLDQSNRELGLLEAPIDTDAKAVYVAKVFRSDEGWQFEPLNRPGDGHTADELAGPAREFL